MTDVVVGAKVRLLRADARHLVGRPSEFDVVEVDVVRAIVGAEYVFVRLSDPTRPWEKPWLWPATDVAVVREAR